MELGDPVRLPLIAGAQGGERVLAAWAHPTDNVIIGRLLDLTGQPVAEPFVVGESSLDPISLSVSGHENGFSVAWSTGNKLWVRHFDLDGEATTDQVLVAENILEFGFRSDLGRAAVASSPAGSLVVYGRQTSFEGTITGILNARPVSAEGVVGDPIIVVQAIDAEPFKPAIARRPGGGFVAAWSSEPDLPGGVWIQRFDESGRTLGTPRRVDSPASSHQNSRLRSIDWSSGGAMALAWSAIEPQSRRRAVYLRALDALGHPMGAEAVLGDVYVDLGDAHVAFASAGHLLLTLTASPDPPIGNPVETHFQAVQRYELSCTPSESVNCLREGRFEVSVEVRDAIAPEGRPATAVPTTSDTGSFWFFSEDNVELLVKVLDGRAHNDHFWVLFGSMSNVAYTVTVRDTVTGAEREFINSQGTLASRAITDAFPDDGSPATETATVQDAPGGGCIDTEMALCLTDGRFRATVEWRDPRNGDSGVATGRVLADNSGAFWFFGPENLELILKVLDGTPSNGHYWVFVGGLTDVELDITVEDADTGSVWRHHKDPFVLESFADIEALPAAVPTS